VNEKKPVRRTHPGDIAVLPQPEFTCIQEVIDTLKFYGRVIDITIMVELGTIASKETKCTQTTAQAVKQLLNYASAHPDTTVRYHASDMCLHTHSDASYLSEGNARSRAVGTFFLSAKPADPQSLLVPTPPPTYKQWRHLHH
jgi:hypothetical protein